LEKGRIYIVAKPVTGVLIFPMLGQTCALVIFIIEPIDLEFIIRIGGIQISTKH
jgi:hypothetical protein